MKDSRIEALYRMTVAERLRALVERGYLDAGQAGRLRTGQPLLSLAGADRMSENVIGVFGLPLAVAPNFRVDGKDYLVPMVIEEPSVVAGVSGAAKLFRAAGGISTSAEEPLLIGQVQLAGIGDPDDAVRALEDRSGELMRLAESGHPRLVERGGGVRELEFHKHRMPDEKWAVVLHLLVDTRDAMGANIVNSMCEAIAPRVREIAGGAAILRILSNLADRALVTARGTVPAAALAAEGFGGEAVRDAIVLAGQLAEVDPYRAATHNKGIMNGIDAVAIATGNDWRAIEAGAHAFASGSGPYRSLSRWTALGNGDLSGELTLPLKVGVVGGSLEANPGARLGLSIAAAGSARELAALMAATGLAQNLAALRALASAGIQHGHMRLHARSVAATAGVPAEHFERVVEAMIESGEIKAWKAAEIASGLHTAHTGVPGTGEEAAEGHAAGKVILLGEHAVVYGREGLALPIRGAVSASVATGAGSCTLAVADWDIRETWAPGEAPRDGAAALVDFVARALGAGDRAFDVRASSRIPVAMGLGSSAAFAVAVIRAFDALLGLGQSDAEIDGLALRCEELTHGTPSGIDNHLATYAKPVLFRRGEPVRPLALAEEPPLVVAASGIRGITRDQVAAVRARHDRNPPLFDALFDQMGRLAGSGASALADGNYDALGDLMNVGHGLLNAIGVSHPSLEKMIAIAREAGARGAKLTGAGGGGSIVALCPGKVREVREALEASGYGVISIRAESD